MVGHAHDKLLKKPFPGITHPKDLDADLDQAERMLKAGSTKHSIEKRYLKKDGSIV